MAGWMLATGVMSVVINALVTTVPARASNCYIQPGASLLLDEGLQKARPWPASNHEIQAITAIVVPKEESAETHPLVWLSERTVIRVVNTGTAVHKYGLDGKNATMIGYVRSEEILLYKYFLISRMARSAIAFV